MTDERRPIRQISGNLQKFQAATRELRYVTVKVAICGDRSVSTNASAVSEANGTTVRVSLDLGVRFRYSRLKEAGRGCGGRGVLWELNRFRFGSHCRNRSYAKSSLLMLIDILLLSASEVIVTPTVSRSRPHSSETVQTLASIHAVASAARAASFKRPSRNERCRCDEVIELRPGSKTLVDDWPA